MKIDTIIKEFQSSRDKMKARALEIRKREEALTKLRADQEAVASRGDVDAYEELGKKISRAEMELTVYIKSTQPPIPTPEQAMASWIEYDGKAGAETMRLYRDYEIARAEACRKYEKAVLSQNEELRKRSELIEMLRGSADSVDGFPLSQPIPDESNYYPRNIQMNGPEFYYFAGSGEWGQVREHGETGNNIWPSLNVINSVVRLQCPVDDPHF